jgi:hypothetical protein
LLVLEALEQQAKNQKATKVILVAQAYYKRLAVVSAARALVTQSFMAAVLVVVPALMPLVAVAAQQGMQRRVVKEQIALFAMVRELAVRLVAVGLEIAALAVVVAAAAVALVYWAKVQTVAVEVITAVAVVEVRAVLQEVLELLVLMVMAVLVAHRAVLEALVETQAVLAVKVPLVLFVLFGPALRVLSHQQTQVICNEFIH